MIGGLVVFLVVLWLLGLVGGVGGSLIHALLFLAALVFIYNLLTRPRKVA